MRYETKFVFHIPHYAYVNGRYESIDHEKFKFELFDKFDQMGVDSWYITESTGYYKKRSYKQELLTVFVDANRPWRVEDAFKDVCEAQKDIMLQELFAYEKDGKLYTFKV